ncbi:MAG: biopolymer transporter ExbD [Proteobacteria bacterium]|nr:MAG: biopolymer transporter ExbD [Pseudomonadota bacterium]PIE40119.1 MAG: biopolymer transporter ExbD [Gammaproteobacteria bacterium]
MRRKHRKLAADTDLDITAFMNLMIVLVPVLLISMVFTQRSVLDLNFPADQSNEVSNLPEQLQLQVVIRNDALVLADSKAGLIKRIDNLETGYDFIGLRNMLKQIKSRLPDKKDITILPEKQTSYQVLVSTMDAVRSFPAVVAASLVEAELFPDISIGEAAEPVQGKIQPDGSG